MKRVAIYGYLFVQKLTVTFIFYNSKIVSMIIFLALEKYPKNFCIFHIALNGIYQIL
jgi:hypothetical protein